MAEVRPWGREGIFSDGGRLLTRSSNPGTRVYGEDLVSCGGVEYRSWDPRRSKLAAALLCGLEAFPFRPESRVLYLGAASGTTASHIADICHRGTIYCVEIAPRPFRDLISVCEGRGNMAPIMADAGNPSHYSQLVCPVDVVYQDIAQRDQIEIFARNLEAVPPSTCVAYLMVKARSIDVSANPAKIFHGVWKGLEERGIKVAERIDLSPYERDHMAMVVSHEAG